TCTCTQNEQRATHALHSHSRVFTALRLAADLVGGVMFNTRGWIALGLLSTFALPAMAQSFRVQCPTSTVTHPNPANNNSEPTYVGATYTGTSGYGTTPAHYNGAVRLAPDVANSVNVLNISEAGTTVTVVGYTPLDLNLQVGRQVIIAGGTDLPAGYKGTFAVTAINVANPFFPSNYAFNYTAPSSGLAAVNEAPSITASF